MLVPGRVYEKGFDPLQDWHRKYHEGMKNSGKEVHLVEYLNAIHGFYLFPELPDFALQRLGVSFKSDQSAFEGFD